jgi:repressor LexA
MTPTHALADMFHLSDRQAEILGFIIAYLDRHGYPPSVRNISERFGIYGTNACQLYLHPLRKKGAIQWEPGHARTLRPMVKLIHPSQLTRTP